MKGLTKKLLLVAFTVAMIVCAMVVDTSAAENHCDYFDELLSKKNGYILRSYDEEKNQYEPEDIARFTFFYTLSDKEKYITDVINDDYGSQEFYTVPAGVFEEAVLRHFYVNDFDAFRRSLSNSYNSFSFDPSNKTYKFVTINGGCGYGGVPPLALYGYKAAGDGKYLIYSYSYYVFTNDNYVPKDGEVEFQDYCVFDDFDGERRVFAIIALYCDTIVIENNSVKFVKTETVSKFPKANGLITAETNADDHVYKAATCTTAKICKICSAVRGKALGHSYTNKCDTTCNRCKATRKITHTYKTTTTKATLTKAGSIVKKCTVCGNVASKTTIKQVKTVKLAATEYTYNGKVINPAVTVKDSAGKVLKKGTDYTVKYATGCKNVGTYKVTVTFKGNYSGTKTLTFTINPQKITLGKVTGGKNTLTIAWTPRTAQATGYEIQYSLKKNFKSAKKVTVTKAKTKTKTVKKLTKGKTYYVRIRTYKTVNGKKFYSAWSAIKSAKIK